MQLLWFLPSIAYGLMLAITSGNYLLLVSTLMSALLMLLVRWRMARQPKLGPDTQLRILGGRIWLDDYRLSSGSAFWSREQFDFVYERLATKSNRTLELAGNLIDGKYSYSTSLSAVVGFDSEDMVSLSLKEDGPHAIVVGPTGSGKTEFLKTFVNGIIQSTKALELVLIDFKGGSGLGVFESSSKQFVTDHDLPATIEAFEFLKHELQRRESQPVRAPMVIVIDELAHLLSEVRIAEAILSSIAARGRSAQMHLIVTNQNLVGIPRALMSNLRLRVLVGQHDPVDAALLGQVAKQLPTPEVGIRLTQAQLVGHGQTGRLFWFNGFRPGPRPEAAPPASEPEPLRRSLPDRRARSDQVPEKRRHGRRRASRDWPVLARKAASR
ncbi:MAG: hypothetical protein RL612_635 [Actinomycetota bacterium]